FNNLSTLRDVANIQWSSSLLQDGRSPFGYSGSIRQRSKCERHLSVFHQSLLKSRHGPPLLDCILSSSSSVSFLLTISDCVACSRSSARRKRCARSYAIFQCFSENSFQPMTAGRLRSGR